MNIDYKVIGNRIQTFRKKQKITQEALAEQINVSVGYISQIERGITKANLSMLAEICFALSCDLSYLVTGIIPVEKGYQTETFVEKYQLLNDKERNIVISLMDTLLRNR